MQKDIAGQRFERLTALRPDTPEKWLFACDCGREKVIWKAGVVSGRVRSCGCLHKERCKSGSNRRKHGDAKAGAVSRLHNIWRGMHKRCSPAANVHARERYADRGIAVCAAWRDYITFRDWAAENGYAEHLTLERIENDGHYAPHNCRWATKLEQARNRSTTRRIEVEGATRCLAEWLEQTGVTRSAFHARIKRGWSLPEALGVTLRAGS